MRARHSLKWYLLPGAGLAAVVVAVLMHVAGVDVDYPLATWRMDLDDAMVGVGTILLGVAGIWTALTKARQAEATALEAHARADRLEHKVNGGMVEFARETMHENEIMATVIHRLDRIEAERDDCIEERKELQRWIIGRLDSAGLGRKEPRNGDTD